MPAIAQYEGTSLDDRIGHGEDSLNTRRNLSMFNMDISNNQFTEAYEVWKPIMEMAPFANLRIYTDGSYMLQTLITQEKDPALKKQYFDELMHLYDLRLQNLAGLNSFAKAHLQATEGDVVYPKAYCYAVYGPQADPEGYTIDNAYSHFATANRLLEQTGGREVKGYMLDIFFRISYAKYQADNNGFREQFLQDYLDSKELCEKMLQMAKEESDPERAARIAAEYDQPLNNIEGIFAQSRAADREQIIAIFGPKIEANKDNLAYLKSALTLMAANDCDDDPVYYRAAEYAYNIQPTYESAIGTAQKYYKEGRNAESVRYYNDAIELCQSEAQKGIIALRVAAAMRKAGDYASAYAYLDRALAYNPDLEGKCFIQRANIAIKEKKYTEAKQYCDRAAAADITLAGQAQRLKANIQTVEAHNAEYARQKAEYDRQQAEIRAEEEFWRQK